MAGLFFFLVCAVWMVGAAKLSATIAGRFKRPAAQWTLGLMVFAVTMAAPISDEIVARHQFKSLCGERTALQINASEIRGRSVRLIFDPSNARVPSTLVPIRFSRVKFREDTTGKELGGFERFTADGGVLVRSLGVSESDAPLLIHPRYCGPAESAQSIAERFGFTIVN